MMLMTWFAPNRQTNIPSRSDTPVLTSTQRKSSRCSRKDFTGPPPSSGGSEENSAMENCGWKNQRSNDFRFRRLRLRGRIGGGKSLGGRHGRGRLSSGGIIDFIRHILRGFFEFLDAMAQAFGQFRYFFRAE